MSYLKYLAGSLVSVAFADQTCATAWVQCGGAGYTGPTCCDAPYQCQQLNTWYSQCSPAKQATKSVPQAPENDKCYDLYSVLSFNSLVQSFPNNPDSKATGYVYCKLCTSGQMSCSGNVDAGKTPLIASHIHVASNGDGASGSGPPVINFCGDNSPGMILDGSKYLTACSHYNNGAALMSTMEGNFIDGAMNEGFTVASRVQDIGENPGKYYFNFHSIASWTYWQLENKGPVGMCRGQVSSSSRRLAATDFHDEKLLV